LFGKLKSPDNDAGKPHVTLVEFLYPARYHGANPKTRLVLGLALEKAAKVRFFLINSG
jgi:hypothetical protein